MPSPFRLGAAHAILLVQSDQALPPRPHVLQHQRCLRRQSLHNYGEFSQGEVDLFAQVVQPGDVVIEVGANIGCHTVWFAKAVTPGGMVIAFEPQRLVYQLLCANIALNSIPNAMCLQMALGRETGTLTVPVMDPTMPGNYGGLSIEGHTQGEPVPVVRLDTYNVPRCKLIKVDVEGMEKVVLEGATGLLTRFRPLLYVENDRKDRSDELIRYIDSLGYDMYWHLPPLFNPANFAQNATNIFGNIVSLNMLCIPKEAKSNLQGFRKVEVPA